MSTQPFLAEPGPAHHHLEFELTSRWDDLIAAISAMWPDDPAAPRVNTVIGFRPTLWPLGKPANLADMAEVTSSDGHRAPATQHDVWVWVHGGAQDAVQHAVHHVLEALAPVTALTSSFACSSFEGNRTVEGFVDGTENPSQFEAFDAAVIDGGSTVLFQHWASTGKAAFLALPVPEQERVIGRTKLESIELDELPENSHVARNVLEVDGVELPILRRNLPLSDESGYVFAGFCKDPSITLRMLERMYGHGEPAIRDRITDYVTAMSGSMYYVPSVEQLSELGALPSQDD